MTATFCLIEFNFVFYNLSKSLDVSDSFPAAALRYFVAY